MIYTVTLNPALDKTMEIPNFLPDAVYAVASVRTDPGGKGINVSKVLKSLGGESIALGILGGHTGEIMEAALKEQGISCKFTHVFGETRTNLKIVDPVGYTNTDLNEPGQPVMHETLQQVRDALLSQLQEGDIVVLSGSIPPQCPVDIYAQWIADCKEKGAKVFLDADKAPLCCSVTAAPYLVKPNRQELERLSGKTLASENELIQAGRKLLQQGICWVVISLGAEGAIFLHGEECYKGDAISVAVRSTVGAGDSMVAALAYATEQNMAVTEMLCFAMAVSAANVTCSGSQPADMAKILELLPQAMVKRI